MSDSALILSYEDFCIEASGYVSKKVIPDSYWKKNKPLINECLFDLYKKYEDKTLNSTNNIIEPVTPRDCGNILEFFLVNFMKYGQKK